VKAQCLPFSQIPDTTSLFTDFLAYSPKVRPFYPHSPHFSEWMKAEASTIHYDASRRERISAILQRQNKSWDASPQTLANNTATPTDSHNLVRLLMRICRLART